MLRPPGLVSCRQVPTCASLPLAKVSTGPEMTRKLKILALHSFRTSGATFSLQVDMIIGTDETAFVVVWYVVV